MIVSHCLVHLSVTVDNRSCHLQPRSTGVSGTSFFISRKIQIPLFFLQPLHLFVGSKSRRQVGILAHGRPTRVRFLGSASILSNCTCTASNTRRSSFVRSTTVSMPTTTPVAQQTETLTRVKLKK